MRACVRVLALSHVRACGFVCVQVRRHEIVYQFQMKDLHDKVDLALQVWTCMCVCVYMYGCG